MSDVNAAEIRSQDYLPLLDKMVQYRYDNLRYGGNRTVEKGDLIGEAYAGLHKAIEKFDPHKSSNFAAYAFYKINYSLLTSLRKQRLISKEKLGALKRLRAATIRLEQELGRKPFDTEIATAMGFQLSQLYALLQYNVKKISLDEQCNSSERPMTLADNLAADLPDLDASIDQPVLAEAMAHCLANALLPEERRILLLMEQQDFPAREVVDMLGGKFSQQKIYRLCKSAKIKMRMCLKHQGISYFSRRRVSSQPAAIKRKKASIEDGTEALRPV